jgi:hypothetical protein
MVCVQESKKQRLLEKVAQLEKRLKVKDSELRGLKSHVTSLSPRMPSSADSSQAYQPHQTPITGIPVTPKMKVRILNRQLNITVSVY